MGIGKPPKRKLHPGTQGKHVSAIFHFIGPKFVILTRAQYIRSHQRKNYKNRQERKWRSRTADIKKKRRCKQKEPYRCKKHPMSFDDKTQIRPRKAGQTHGQQTYQKP